MWNQELGAKIPAIAILLIAASFGAPAALADRVNNGGPGIACRSDDEAEVKNVVETLDLHEARLRGLTIDLGPSQKLVLEKIDMALQRLARLDPEREARYRARLADVFAALEFDLDDDLGLVDDLGEFEMKTGCELVQLARRSQLDEVVHIVVSKRMWDLLDGDNRAALMLHEVIYDEAIEVYGHTTSDATRRLNGLLMSSDFETISHQDYVDLLIQLRLLDTHLAE